MKDAQFLSPKEISNWQLQPSKQKVKLPALQRGYVWKPKQVETLWDSLLRGFPVGSFLVSEAGETGQYDLLDGQQRATAIAMGFYNPWNPNNNIGFFSDKFKHPEKTVPILWLDIAPAEHVKGDKTDQIFLPKLITQSHPWGYNYNGKTLSLSDRRKGMEHFERTGNHYPYYILSDTYPIQSIMPVPMCLLIESISEHADTWKEELIRKCSASLFLKGSKNLEEKEKYLIELEEKLRDSAITLKIENAIKRLLETKIPILSIGREQRENEANTDLDEDSSTLFIRVNTAGTKLEGEELIYSLYKSIFPEAKNIVEEAATGFIAPTRIISLISRIVLTDISRSAGQKFKFAKQLTFKQFKNNINDKNGEFYNGLKRFISDEEQPVIKLFQIVKEILTGTKDFQLPLPLAVEIAGGKPDILFMLLYFIHSKDITAEEVLGDETLHKNILGSITLIHFFSQDTTAFLDQLAEMQKSTPEKDFFEPKMFIEDSQPIDEKNWRPLIYSPSDLKAKLEEWLGLESWDKVFLKRENEKKLFLDFFNRLNSQRQFLLFAQRGYIKDKFQQLQWEVLLEDANRPFDWDHIYPDSWWAYNLANQNNLTKHWRWSIGNFRALALEDNRSEGNRISPKDRLESNIDKSFVKAGNWELWKKIEGRITNDQAPLLTEAIVFRLVDIYREWYETLNIGILTLEKSGISETALLTQD